jgi:hypothetical protein
MSEDGQDAQASGLRLSSRTAYLLSLALNTTVGFLGQFALFYPYFVARDWLAGLGFGSPGIPFRDGYLGALLIGLALVVAFATITAASNFAVVRRSSVSRLPYWSSAASVALLSSVVQLLLNMGSLYS